MALKNLADAMKKSGPFGPYVNLQKFVGENDLFITSEADVKEFHDLWNKYITDNTFPKPTYANLKKLQAEVEKGKKQMLYLIVGNSKDEKDISSISNLIKLHTSLHRAKKHNEYNVQDTIS